MLCPYVRIPYAVRLGDFSRLLGIITLAERDVRHRGLG